MIIMIMSHDRYIRRVALYLVAKNTFQSQNFKHDIPTIRGLTFFRGDNSISQLDCRKLFRLDIFPPSGDPALCYSVLGTSRLVEYMILQEKKRQGMLEKVPHNIHYSKIFYLW